MREDVRWPRPALARLESSLLSCLSNWQPRLPCPPPPPPCCPPQSNWGYNLGSNDWEGPTGYITGKDIDPLMGSQWERKVRRRRCPPAPLPGLAWPAIACAGPCGAWRGAAGLLYTTAMPVAAMPACAAGPAGMARA